MHWNQSVQVLSALSKNNSINYSLQEFNSFIWNLIPLCSCSTSSLYHEDKQGIDVYFLPRSCDYLADVISISLRALRASTVPAAPWGAQGNLHPISALDTLLCPLTSPMRLRLFLTPVGTFLEAAVQPGKYSINCCQR